MKQRFIACAIGSGRIWLTLAAVACDGGADMVDRSADDATVIVGQRDASFEDSSGAEDTDGGDTDVAPGAAHEAAVPELDASAQGADGGTLDAQAHEDGALDVAQPPSDGAPASDAPALVTPDDAGPQGTQDAGSQGREDATVTPDSGAPGCTANCLGRVCGNDGCGGSCGPCAQNRVCNAGGTECVCTPNCAGRVCGDNGCGGSCGSCTSGTCSAQGSCICTPNCAGRTCGDDGCGGSCGACTSGQSCGVSGQCTWPARAFAADVYPIFLAAGCPDCHDASSPSAGLDLSSVSAAHANLVGNAGGECSPARLLVAPLSPETSYLINKLTGVGMCSGLRMPRGRTPLSNSEIDLIRAWIGSGAAL